MGHLWGSWQGVERMRCWWLCGHGQLTTPLSVSIPPEDKEGPWALVYYPGVSGCGFIPHGGGLVWVQVRGRGVSKAVPPPTPIFARAAGKHPTGLARPSGPFPKRWVSGWNTQEWYVQVGMLTCVSWGPMRGTAL